MQIVAFSEKRTAQSHQVGGRSTPPLQLDIPNGALNYNFVLIRKNARAWQRVRYFYWKKFSSIIRSGRTSVNTLTSHG
jgi:hypothetical protein